MQSQTHIYTFTQVKKGDTDMNVQLGAYEAVTIQTHDTAYHTKNKEDISRIRTKFVPYWAENER